MTGKLNIFQRAMLRWNGLHPYNAVHVLRIAAPLDPTRLHKAVDHTLETLGLTGLTLDPRHSQCIYAGGPSHTAITLLECGKDPRSTLVAEAGRQLNTPFTHNQPFNPFRFFVLPESGGFSLGLAYFHAVADAESIVHLLRDIVRTYQATTPASPAPVTVPAVCPDNPFRHPGVLFKKLLSLPSLVKILRTSCRPFYRDTQDMANGIELFSLPPEHLPRLQHCSRSWDVTLNDLFLALLLKSIASHVPDKLRDARRKRLSIGCIVNTRRDLGVKDRTFGVFLGSFVVSHRMPDDIRLRDLAGNIRRQTLKIKQDKSYLASSLELVLDRVMLSLSSTGQLKKRYQKNYPLWGGVTNMNLNSLWAAQNEKEPVDYFRAVSTGPVTPLVLSTSTFRDVVNIAITYRSTVFTPMEIGRIRQSFLDEIQSMEAA
jgi:NRPS condensation-like uncharacterized protein